MNNQYGRIQKLKVDLFALGYKNIIRCLVSQICHKKSDHWGRTYQTYAIRGDDIGGLTSDVWSQMSQLRLGHQMSDITRLILDITRQSIYVYQTSAIGSLTTDVWHIHITSDIWYQTSDIRHLNSDNKQQTSSITRLVSDIWNQTSDIRLTSDIRCLTSYEKHQTSDITQLISHCKHQTSDIRDMTSDI